MVFESVISPSYGSCKTQIKHDSIYRRIKLRNEQEDEEKEGDDEKEDKEEQKEWRVQKEGKRSG